MQKLFRLWGTLISLGLIFVVSSLAFPQDLETETARSEFTAYLVWLRENPGDFAFSTVFQRALQSIHHFTDAEALHVEFFNQLRNSEKAQLLQLLADLAEQISDYTSAWTYYKQLLALQEDPEHRVKLAIQSLLLGEYQRALTELNEGYFPESLKNASLVYKLYIYTFLGESDATKHLMQSIRVADLPGFELIALWEYAQQLEAHKLLEKINAEIQSRDDSAFLSFITTHKNLEQINIFPNPLLLLALSDTLPDQESVEQDDPIDVKDNLLSKDTHAPFGIQIGSFRDASNAVSYALSIMSSYAAIRIYKAQVQSDMVYRVYAENIERHSTETFIVEMKSKQIEGVIHLTSPPNTNLVDRAEWAALQ